MVVKQTDTIYPIMNDLGDFIDGSFVSSNGDHLQSTSPVDPNEVIYNTKTSVKQVEMAVEAAATSNESWASLGRHERFESLKRFRACLKADKERLAQAISSETGKLLSEARGEANALVNRFDLVFNTALVDLKEGQVPGFPGEELRYQPLGVVGVIGPFNYPLHLCHAHVVPALLMGNSVVIKPSEVAPLSAALYAECAQKAELPKGVFNLVQGRGESGAALAAHSKVRGLCFTGSYNVGQKLTHVAARRPELLLALEMGGKNTVVVLDDADIPQAAHEIVVGAFLTTGQRCTATDRVLVHESRLDELCRALASLAGAIHFGDPKDATSFAGPLSTKAGFEHYKKTITSLKDSAECVFKGEAPQSGYFVPPTIHKLPPGTKGVPGYTDAELFGPDIGIESFADDTQAIKTLADSPYGLANSVFTFSDERFETFYRQTHSGILNRNRSTNMASPRLPFGGLGKSGNYRPAGAWASRNVVSAVAVQENVIGRVAMHPMLVDAMPAPELDRLEKQHGEEECKEAARNLLTEPRPMKVLLPKGGVLPKSSEWLTRLYAAERVVREKKPLVFDHMRSKGPYMVSVDEQPLSVLDGMSQTATLCGGFSEDLVSKAYAEGVFGESLVRNQDWCVEDVEAVHEFATTLRQLVPGLSEVTFANSGAEANEKAFALALKATDDPKRRKVLAFEGSFHGRTLLSLSATYNPVKRAPYEFKGYEATFAPFPVWNTPSEKEPLAPSGFYAAAGRGELEDLIRRFGDKDEDPLLASEIESLSMVHKELQGGEVFVVTVEPMQSEGGDRYGTTRFFRALRLLTRHHGVPLIFDEVQTGFGLGGAFAWHTQFNLVNFKGQPDFPDAVVFAKRAQVGVCMSNWRDEEPTTTQVASVVRGRLHADMVAVTHHAERIENLVKPRLETLAKGFPHLVANPRAKGFAIAFDLPTKDHLMAYLGQRFWRGTVVFGAGTRTVRYRLSDGFWKQEIELLFDSIRRSLAWLDAHPGAKPPAWEDFPKTARAPKDSMGNVAIREVKGKACLDLLSAILKIELEVYEPARQTPPDEIRAALEDVDGITVVAEEGGKLVGFVIGLPLEKSSIYEEGPEQDVMHGHNNSLYSMSLTVDKAYQGFGIGRKLKSEQLKIAETRLDKDGARRFRFVTGRNRVGHTAAMTHLNQAYGAHLVEVLMGQYEDPEGQAIYYRIPLKPWAPLNALAAKKETAKLPTRLDTGISVPLKEIPKSLANALDSGLLYGPAVNKLTIMNYATPGMVRALEWIGALVPRLPHMFVTSCRDECFDKSVRLLRTHRKEAQIPVGFVGGYMGHTSAGARSLSDPSLHLAGKPYYNWPLVPHPEDVGHEASLALLKETVIEHGGAKNILGVFVEPMQERTGATLSGEFSAELTSFCKNHHIPLVCMETATSGYRSGQGAFFHEHVGLRPDVLCWWGGSQTGYMHVTGEMRVSKPLTLVSTWDGDELSLVREHHQLRAARHLDVSQASKTLDDISKQFSALGLRTRGQGLYRVIETKARQDEFEAMLKERKIHLRKFGSGRFGVVPPLDVTSDDLSPLATLAKDLTS